MAYVYLSRQRSKPFYSPHFQLFSIEQCIILVWSTTSAPHTSQSTNTNDGDWVGGNTLHNVEQTSQVTRLSRVGPAFSMKDPLWFNVLMSSSYRTIQVVEGFQVIIVVLVTVVSKWTPRGRRKRSKKKRKRKRKRRRREGGKRRRRSTMLLGRESIPPVNNAIGLHIVGEILLREEGWSMVVKEANKNKSRSGSLKEIWNTICAKSDRQTIGCKQKPVQPRVLVSGALVSGAQEQQRPQWETIAAPLFRQSRTHVPMTGMGSCHEVYMEASLTSGNSIRAPEQQRLHSHGCPTLHKAAHIYNVWILWSKVASRICTIFRKAWVLLILHIFLQWPDLPAARVNSARFVQCY